jgi:dTMP kinase
LFLGTCLVVKNFGRFITIEGGEGAGKSTQIAALVDRLAQIGIASCQTREPGGSKGAERIRELMLTAGGSRYSPLTETLLFYAARNDHLESLIRPNLSTGTWVISDRFSDSTRVYQGLMGKIAPETLTVLDHIVVGETQPDLTLVLDLPPEIGLKRAAARRGASAPDAFESESLAFHQGLREGFLALATQNPARCVVIDASGGKDDVSSRIWRVVSTKLLGGIGVGP